MTEKIYVWDRFVRLFHWLLVVFVVLSYITGENEIEAIHPYSGYAIFILVCLRVVWGFIGSKYARFSSFIYPVSETKDYAQGLVTNSAKHYLGHNPLGGLMVIALLLTLFATTLSGMKLYAAEENKGPFAQMDTITLVQSAYASSDDDHYSEHHDDDEHEGAENEEQEEFWEEVHESCINLLVLLVTLHILGVIVSSFMHKESLVKAMVSGYKERKGSQN